jgi:hypothetical protein
MGCVTRQLRQRALERIAPPVNHSVAVAEDQQLALDTQADEEPCASKPGSTRATENHPNLFDPLADDRQPVDQCRTCDDRRTVLVVVEYRDLEPALTLTL